MDRRAFLTSTLQELSPGGDPIKKKNKYANKKLPSFKSNFSGVEPYEGPWTLLEASHLLNRTMFGYTRQQLDQVKNMDMTTAVNTVLTAYANPAPPVNNYYNEVTDLTCLPGLTWVDKGYNDAVNTKRVFSLKDWWLGLMLKQQISVHEKMVLFWHNLFATQTAVVQNAQYLYKYNQLLRTYALGNYKALTKAVTLDPAMLLYLNGARNQRVKPDENYARELQELFTLGKGPNSQYTEDDVMAAARVLTGYQIDNNTEQYIFNPSRHDTTDKQFSAFYNNTVITGRSGAAGEDELDDLLNMIFSKEEVSLNIARELYRWFIYYVIDDEVEEKVIAPLAQTFRDNNYEILPVLRQLFKSAHFYDIYNSGCFIKTPIDFTLCTIKNFGIVLPATTPAEEYTGYRALNIYHALMGMDPGDPPNVAGWEAFWNAPAYHEFWINSVTLPYRNGFSEILITPAGYKYKNVTIKADIMEFTKTIPDAEDPNLLIQFLEDKFMATELSSGVVDALKSILLSGQTQDYYWTTAWNNYADNPGNTAYYNIVYARLYPFYKYLLHLAEYQLI